MTCQECEGLLASEDTSAELDRHLAECVECRELAADLRANADAFREMTAMPLPSVSGAVLAQVRRQETRRQVARWGWALAAAAAIVIGFLATRQVPVAPLPPVVIAEAPAMEEQRQATRSPAPQVARASRRQVTRSPALQEPLKVKMFTSDPDVVIYWLVDPKEGSE
jgi:anti-sigma factor RsiW